MDKKELEKNKWKNEQYLFELQKFLDLADNNKNEQIRKAIISQMLKCNKKIKKIAEEIFNKRHN